MIKNLRALNLFGLVFALSLVVSTPAPAQEAEFGYEGEIGPSNWAELSPEYSTCATGIQQSPVDIPSSAPTNTVEPDFDYRPSDLNVANTGHSLQANYQPGSSLQLAGQSYKLDQFHFHNPSEHTVDGDAAPLSLHLVHENSQGEIAVVSLFVVQGKKNEALSQVFENLPEQEGESAVPGENVDAAKILPGDRSYWRYDGSLTTPPCSEGVKWLVMQEPVEVSAEQISAHNEIYSDNARPIQPLNGREFLGSEPGTEKSADSDLPDTGGLAVLPAAGGLLVSLAGAGLLAGVALRKRWRRQDGGSSDPGT